jgi:protein-S-isoprenylcysteine O-methyltransferase Ste14
MNSKTFAVMLAICVITHVIRFAYEILKHAKILKPRKLTFAFIFLDMFVLWSSWFTLCSIDVFRMNLPGVIRILGLSVFFIGVILFFVALFTIKTFETYAGDLITKGIYSKIRHPMYLGFIFWSIGFPLYHGAIYPFSLSFLFIANILFWRHLEEIELEERFPDYKNYKAKTLF